MSARTIGQLVKSAMRRQTIIGSIMMATCVVTTFAIYMQQALVQRLAVARTTVEASIPKLQSLLLYGNLEASDLIVQRFAENGGGIRFELSSKICAPKPDLINISCIDIGIAGRKLGAVSWSLVPLELIDWRLAVVIAFGLCGLALLFGAIQRSTSRSLQASVVEPLAELSRLIESTVSLDTLPSRIARIGPLPAFEIEYLEKALFDAHRRLTATEGELTESRILAAVGRAAQMLAHDVRKPFSLLQISLGQIERLTSDPLALKTYVPRLRQHLSGMLVHVNGMIMDVMEASSDKVSLKREAVDLRVIIASAAEQAFDFASPAGITMKEDFRHESVIRIDSLKMTRVFANIIANAKDAMKSVGVITISSHDCGQQVEVAIHNTGSFVPLEIRETMFEPFFTSGKKRGTGLGLAIAQKIVEAHGGAIRCESDAAGTAFIFSF